MHLAQQQVRAGNAIRVLSECKRSNPLGQFAKGSPGQRSLGNWSLVEGILSYNKIPYSRFTMHIRTTKALRSPAAKKLV